MVRFIFVLLKCILYFIDCIVIYILIALLFSNIALNKNSAGQDVTIFVKTNGMHTDIVLPVSNAQFNWKEIVPPSDFKIDSVQLKYIGIGWGDWGFYKNSAPLGNIGPKEILFAGIGIDATAMHVAYYTDVFENEDCRKITISNDQYLKLVQYIYHTFDLENNQAIRLNDTIGNAIHYFNNDAFFKANGNYSIFNTCNTWTNNAFRTSGLKCCFWTPFDKGIMALYK